MSVLKRRKILFVAFISVCLGTMLFYLLSDSVEPTFQRYRNFSLRSSLLWPASQAPDKATIPAEGRPSPDPKVTAVSNSPTSNGSGATKTANNVTRRRSSVVVEKAGKALIAVSTTLVEPKAKVAVNWTVGSGPASKECPLKPPELEGELFTYKDAPHFEDMMARLRPGLEPGGHYRPSTCRARHRVAIIIPYRDRQNHLHVLLSNLHPMLMRQQLDYFILVVEMVMPTEFNRGLLLNIGAVEALGLWDVHCFIFHDVDLIPENDRNLYTCPQHFRHMAVAMDKFKYSVLYETYVGGVAAMNKNDFYKINGHSNLYFGWGGEDDDFYNRFQLLNDWKARQHEDGLNSLKYEVVDLQFRTAYTRILVRVEKDAYF